MTGMGRIKKVTPQTHNRFLNLYELEAERRNGKVSPYFVASRAATPKGLKAVSHNDRCDGVIIYGVYGESKDKIVLIRQYRYPLDGYIYEFPAGLVEEGESPHDTAIREIYEETGLSFCPKNVDPAYSKPFFTTIGMTDECCGTVYGYCTGTPSNVHQEDSEDIEVVLADREECRRILHEENVAIMCAYMLMHFIHSDGGDPLAFLDES